MTLRLGLDLDGVVRDWLGMLVELWEAETGQKVDPAQCTTWDLRDTFKDDAWDVQRFAFEEWAYEIGALAQPIAGALAGIGRLADAGAEIILLTAHHSRPARRAAIHWLDETALPLRGLFFFDHDADKTQIPCDLYVDDAPHQAEHFARAGVPHVVFDQPYNRCLDDSVPKRTRVKNWTELSERIMEELVWQCGG